MGVRWPGGCLRICCVSDTDKFPPRPGEDAAADLVGAAAPAATPAKDPRSLKLQTVRFLISGIIAAVVDFGVTFVALNYFGASLFWGKTLGWIFGTITAYIINSRWTFSSSSSVARIIAVAVLYLVTFYTQVKIFEALVPYLNQSLGWDVRLAQFGAFVVAQGVATVINFIIQRVVIFRVR